MVPIYNNGDSKEIQRISEVIEKHAHAHSQLPLSCMLQKRKQGEIKVKGKATEVAREAYEEVSTYITIN